MNYWFTSDTHFGHANIIRYCGRPFTDVNEMDAELIKRWNLLVKPGDVVYHLGDFAFKVDNGIPALRRKLNGDVHLIYGNHDKWAHRFHGPAAGFAWVGPYKEIKIAEQKIILMHYAMHVWNRSHHGSWMLHGHSHGTLPRDMTKRRMDVGVDPNHYAPISFDEIRMKMNEITFAPVDHHGEGE